MTAGVQSLYGLLAAVHKGTALRLPFHIFSNTARTSSFPIVCRPAECIPFMECTPQMCPAVVHKGTALHLPSHVSRLPFHLLVEIFIHRQHIFPPNLPPPFIERPSDQIQA